MQALAAILLAAACAVGPSRSFTWEQGANTGAVGELEDGLIIHGRWQVWLLLGSRLWGSDTILSTYDKRVGINASVTF